MGVSVGRFNGIVAGVTCFGICTKGGTDCSGHDED